jgi:hypothetical protein
MHRIALPIVTLVVAINFLTMPAEEYLGDADAVRAETIALLNTGKWAVPVDLAKTYGDRGQYFVQNAKGNYYPKYGVFNTLIYLPPLWLEKIATGDLVINSTIRVWFLNLLNVALSGATAFYLILLARRYTRCRPERQSNGSKAIAAIFVLTSLYSTFWWNYLRAQTFEIYHTLFLLAFFYHFVVALDRDGANKSQRQRDIQFLTAAILFGALCLSKSVYVVLLPGIIWAFAQRTMSILTLARNLHPHLNPLSAPPSRDPGADQPLPSHGSASAQRQVRVIGKRQVLSKQLLFFWLPVAILLCLLAWTNWYKFDSPFATGYTQWQKESRLFTKANIFPALRGFLFSPHHSVFLHYPPLFFALAGWPILFKRHKVDATVAVLSGIALLLVCSMFVNWRGQSSYGPRYLLPILPILSLPFITYLEWLAQLSNKIAKLFLAGATAILLSYSMLLQICVNTLPFFFFYSLSNVLDDKQHTRASHYLRSRQFGTIERDFLLYQFGHTSPFAGKFLDQLNSAELERVSALIESPQSNYYWFPNLLRGRE